jgi:hypothetical protein
MKIKELLQERVINVFDAGSKRSMFAIIEPMLQSTYQDIGGLGTVDIENLVQTPGLWKIIRKGTEIVAGVLYRDSKGNKIRLVFRNGTPEGKAELKKILQDDLRLARSWVEVSGPLEKYLTKIGARKIPASEAGEILGAKIDSIHDDGFSLFQNDRRKESYKDSNG